MKTEQELKNQCTLEFINWMYELAEGFECAEFNSKQYDKIIINSNDTLQWGEEFVFSILIRRAIDGWNKQYFPKQRITILYNLTVRYNQNLKKYYKYCDYQCKKLTVIECACLECLLDIFEKKEDEIKE